MSETQNTNIEEPDDLEHYVRSGDYQADKEQAGVEEIVLPPTPIVQAREVILPVIMRKGEDLAILGDAVYDPETSKMVVSFNTQPGRDIAELIGSGMLAAISFTGHMSKRDSFNN